MKTRKEKIRKIIRWLGNIVILFLLIIALLSTYSKLQTRRNPNHIPSIAGLTPMSVLTGSMRPMLEPGDMIVTRKLTPEKIEVGDIITYRISNNALVTHRVIDVVRENGSFWFQTKGDANNTEDLQLINSNEIVGTYLFKIPKGGYVTSFIRTPLATLFLIVLPVLILIGNELRKVLIGVDKNIKI